MATGLRMAWPDPPRFDTIEKHLSDIEAALKQSTAPLDSILGALEAIAITLRDQLAYDWVTSEDILKIGHGLMEVDAHLEDAGDELIRYDNTKNCVGHLWPAFLMMRETHGSLEKKRKRKTMA